MDIVIFSDYLLLLKIIKQVKINSIRLKRIKEKRIIFNPFQINYEINLSIYFDF